MRPIVHVLIPTADYLMRFTQSLFDSLLERTGSQEYTHVDSPDIGTGYVQHT